MAHAAVSMALLPQLTKTQIGTHAVDGSVRIGRGERQGYVLHGPLCRLDPGNYELIFRCKVGAAEYAAHPVIGVEVVTLPGGQLVWRDFSNDELASGSGTIRFVVTPNSRSGAAEPASFNFKFFHFSTADLEITRVDLFSADQGADAGTASYATRYRLLTRLLVQRIAQRHGDGRVTVSRRSRQGAFLGAPQSLRLSSRSYRLSIGGRAGPARVPGQPVLGVEVGTRTQIAYRDFTAEELQQGGAFLDFLPAVAEVDHDAYVELHHFGNADLEIHCADLALVEPPAVAMIPKFWRLSGRLRSPARLFGERFSKWSPVLRGLPVRFGIRPRLILAVGSYRLTFDLHGDGTRVPSGPLLDVEVVTISNWHPPRWLDRVARFLRWRRRAVLGHIATYQVSSEQLNEGRGTYDFNIPADSTYDGDHAWVDLRFYRRTKARLQIEQANIASLPAHEAPLASTASRCMSRQSRRTKLVIFGTCQAQMLARIFMTELGRSFRSSYQPACLPHRAAEQCAREIEDADILLVEDVSAWDSYPLRERVRDTTRLVRFPSLRLASLWPFDHQNGPDDPQATRLDWPQKTFDHLDGLLARLRKEIPDHEERFAKYAALQAELIAPPLRLHDFERRRLLAMDRRFQTGIGQYITEHFQHRQLFHTTTHPAGEIFALLVQYVTKVLDLKKTIYKPGEICDFYFGTAQVPVHPMVARMLGVEWAHERTLYRYRSEQITWEAYVRRYISHYG